MNRPPFSFCLCPDSRLLQTRIGALLAAHPPGNGVPDAMGGGLPGLPLPKASPEASPSQGWQRFVFWGDEGLPAAFWEHLTLQGLFATPKVLILRNAQNLPAETLKTLSQALEPLARQRDNSLIWPMICLEVAFERGVPKVAAHIQRLPCYALAEKNRWIDSTPGLTSQTIPAHIRAEAARHGLVLDSALTGKLAQTLPPDAAQISSELAKLALASGPDGRLPPEALQLVEQHAEANIFELLRQVQHSSNTPAAWRQILEDRLGGENSVFAFIAILLREGRVLWQTLAGSPPPLPPQAAAAKKIISQSLGAVGIAKLWELALTADKGIKTGERSPEQAFEMLAAELFTLFRSTRSC